MNTQFDELAKGLARSVTRRQALKKFGVGLAGMALACFGLADKAEAKGCLPVDSYCVPQPTKGSPKCCGGLKCTNSYGFGWFCV
jgi:hypothetical protein